MITSTSNAKVKQIRALQKRARERRAAGLFVIEGVRMAEEGLASGWPIEYGVYGADLGERGSTLVEKLRANGVLLEEASDQVMASASDTKTPQGILLVLRLPEDKTPDRLSLCLVADGVRDPGNLGTMLRSAAAAGAEAALLTPGNADAYAPKVLRAGMGAHFRLTAAEMDWEAIGQLMRQSGMKMWLADAGGETIYTEADLRGGTAIVIGGEAEGAGGQAKAMADGRLRIPMAGQSESLNAAMAASIILFEAARQRA